MVMRKRRRKVRRKRSKMVTLTSTSALLNLRPRAFKALPSAYRNDSVLNFKMLGNTLVAYPKKSERKLLGDFISVYKNGKWSR